MACTLLLLAILASGTLWLAKRSGATSQEVIVLIANLDGPENYKVTQAVIARMRESVEKNIQGVRVVPLGRKITEQEGPQKAQEEGRRAGANLVLWGYYNTFYRGQIHIEQIKTPQRLHLLKGSFDLNPPAAERKGLTVEEDLSAELNYLVLLVTGLTRFEVGEYAAAIECYDRALNQRSAPEQLIDQLDIYLQRGQAWLHLETTEAFDRHHFSERSKGGDAFHLGGEEFPPNHSALDQAIGDFTTVITARPNDVSGLLNRALAYARKGDYQKALDGYDLILKNFPDYAQAYSGRGVIHNLLENYDEAITDYNTAEKLTQQKDAEVYFNRAISFVNKNEYRQALDDFNRALAIDKSDADSIISRARVFARLGYYPKAVSELDRALEGVPQSVFYHSIRGAAWAEIGEIDKALSDYSVVIDLKPNSSIGYHNRGHLLRDLRRVDEAVTDFSKVINLDPKAGYAYNDRGTCWVNKGNDPEAIKDYTEATTLDPDEGLSWVNRALAHKRLKQYPAAIMDLTKAAECNFDQKYKAYYLRGQIKSEMGDYLGAIDDYASAIKEQPGFIDLWLDKASTWMKVEKYDSAMREYRTAFSFEVALSGGSGLAERGNVYSTAITNLTWALKNRPSSSDGYVARCLAHLLSNQYEEALKDADAAMKLDSSSHETYIYQGIVLTKLRRFDEARGSFDHAINLNPQSAQPWYFRGLTYASQEQFDQAIDNYSRAKNLGPDFLAPRIEIGRCYALQRDFQRAIDELTAVPETSSNYDEVLLLRGQASADLGNREAAATDLRRAYYLARSPRLREVAAAELARLSMPISTF